MLLCCEIPPSMLWCSTNNAYFDKPIWQVLQNIIAVQPSVAKYEWTMYQIKVD